MNRRHFIGAVGAVAIAPFATKYVAIDATNPALPKTMVFPQDNWIDFPEAITGVFPNHDHFLVFTQRAIYKLDGCRGPFMYQQERPVRLWAMSMRDSACVTKRHKLDT